MSDELKACGCCGRYSNEVGFDEDCYGSSWWVECPECGARTGRHDTRADAISAWNRRTVTQFTADLMGGSLYMNTEPKLTVDEARELTWKMLRAAGFEVAE